ncbi:MAG: efflux RND transporter periplasmic adaptor subunit [Bacteroidaceae bacterium]|nr:efflux RND transporter periplasmic adaptor subunit [Bacteroidaceae bacterium]
MNIRTLLMAATGTLLLAACGTKQEQRQKAPTRVRTEVVGQNSSAQSHTYVGVVEEATATAVSFTTMGTVRRVAVSEGQNVSRGQLIAEMDDTQARNLLQGAQAAVNQAEDALKRYQLLHERGSLTEAQWVEIQSKVAQAHSQLAIAKKNVADCRLTAPVSGVVGRQSVKAGETAMPSQAVVTILNVGSVKVRFSVPEADMTAITPQTRSLIQVEAIGRDFAGQRIEKGVQADALTHTYDVRVSVDNKDRALLPGMVAKVSLDTQGPATPMLTLPLTAVQRRADGSLFVWSIGADSTAHRTAVTLGQTVGNRVQANGLTEGARVVTEGYQKLSEGTKVIF